MFIIGVVLLALELIVENLYNVTLQRDLTRQASKVNELKARLYDHQMEQRDRDLQARPVTAPGLRPACCASPTGCSRVPLAALCPPPLPAPIQCMSPLPLRHWKQFAPRLDAGGGTTHTQLFRPPPPPTSKPRGLRSILFPTLVVTDSLTNRIQRRADRGSHGPRPFSG